MSYNDELVSQLPKSLSAEENLELVTKVVAGDKDARERMICGNTAGVISLVDSHIRQFPFLAHLRDDLTSAGFTGLVCAVNRLAIDYDPELGDLQDYIVTAVLHEVYQTVEAETTIPIPHATQWRKTAAGNKIKPLIASSISLDSLTHDHTEQLFDMHDLIMSCCTNDSERTFVEMREAGYTLKEVATQLKMPVSTLGDMKQRIYARVLEKSGLRHIKKGD